MALPQVLSFQQPAPWWAGGGGGSKGTDIEWETSKERPLTVEAKTPGLELWSPQVPHKSGLGPGGA